MTWPAGAFDAPAGLAFLPGEKPRCSFIFGDASGTRRHGDVVTPSEDPPAGNEAAATRTAGARSSRRYVRLLVAVAGYLAIVVLAARTIDRERFVSVLSRLDATDLGAVFTLIGAHLVSRGLRYHALAVRAGAKGYGVADGFRIFLLGLSASLATPARAGDVVKAELLKAFGVRRAVGLGLVAIERILDLIVVCAMIVVTGALLARQTQQSSLQVGAAVLLGVLIAGVASVTIRRLRSAGIRLIARFGSRLVKAVRRERVEDIAHRLFDVWDEVFASPRVLARYLLVTLVAWLADFVKLWVLLRAAGSQVELLAVLFVYPISLIAGILSLLPFSEGVVGVAAIALLNRLAGVNLATGTAAVAVDRGISTLSPLFAYALLTLGRAMARRRAA